MKMYSFDRTGWLESRGYLDKRLAFLDLNFWINLAEPQNSQQEEVARLLSSLVEARKVICPVSVSLLLELAKQPRSIRRDTQSRLMDELSQGLSLRMVEDIFHQEFENTLQDRHTERQAAYSHFLDAAWQGITLPAPGQRTENQVPRELAEALARAMFSLLIGMTITDFLNTWMGGATENSVPSMRQAFSERALQEREWRRENIPSRLGVEHAEFEGTFQALRPTMLRVISTVDPDGLRNWKMDELISLLDECPSFWCSYKMMSAARNNRPALIENDVWDFLNVAFAVPYVDCLACDNATRHICSNVLSMDQKYGTRIVSRWEDFLAWLHDLN